MADVPVWVRRVRRNTRENQYINTINAQDRVTIEFVWYPGAATSRHSWVDTLIERPRPGGRRRNIKYKWSRPGQPMVERVMNLGRITIPLPPGGRGTLSVFGTSWLIRRVGLGVNMTAANQLRGVQQRLNRLGYHLRRPGKKNSGCDDTYGRNSEEAVLAYQAEYRPAPGAVGGLANRLRVRGEWHNEPGIQANLNAYAGVAVGNPSAADGAALQAALVAQVGA